MVRPLVTYYGPRSNAVPKAGVRRWRYCDADLMVHNSWSQEEEARSPVLRVGVMLDSYTVPLWIRRILEEIAAAPFADLVLVIIDASTPPPARRPLRERLRTLGATAFSRYQSFDYRRTRSPFDAFEMTDVSDLLTEAIHVLPVNNPYAHTFHEADIEQIRANQLDVLLRLGFRVVRGEILNCARYGVWSFHHGDNTRYRGGPPLFWELYEGTPISGSVLEILTEDPGAGSVIYRSYSATDLCSLYRNRNAVYWKTAHFVIRCLRDLYTNGFHDLLTQYLDDETQDLGRIYRTPSLLQMARFSGRVAKRSIPSKIRLATSREQWFVALRDKRADAGESMVFMESPSDRFYADPCIVEREGHHFVFIEDYLYSEGRGMISCFEIFEDGSLSTPVRVLEREYHLSYPFVFEQDGQMYMIPESAANRTVELYRATSFPVEWQLERLLLEDVLALDPTLLVHDEKLWLFASVPEEGANVGDELSVFVSDSLSGQWIPHPRNPVVSDIRRARPAGRIFIHGNELVRPGQDSSQTYGYAVVLNRIEALNDTEYREHPISRIEPTWTRRNLATHTYSFDSRYEVLDGRRWRLRLPARR